MNQHPANAVFRAITSVARAQCQNHRRDDHGWPLGNCVECADFRKKMDDWHFEQVLSGNHDPDRFDNRLDLDSEKGVA